MIRYCYILLFFFIAGISFGQSKQVLLREADYYFSQQDFYAASHFFELAYQKDSGDVQQWWKMAEVYRFTFQYDLAAQFYRKVYQKDRALNYPNVQLWEGVMLKQSDDYERAIKTLQSYLENQVNPSNFYYRKGLMELKGANLAISLQNTETIVQHLNENINSKVSDFAPFALGDSVLYFSSLEKGDGTETEQLLGHHSKLLKSENQQLAEVLRVFNTPDYHLGNISFNPTADEVFFTKCKTEKEGMRCAIYSAKLVNGLWENPQQMSSEINKPNTTNTHPQWAFWKEQEGLFFTSNRKGGWGGMDIWFAPKEGVATNLGGTINTTGDEVTPFYHSIEQKLYFSSDFHPGIGGFDIFQTTWDNEWGVVENVGKPLNSSHNDLYYNSRIDNPLKGYLSSNRKGSLFVDKESCCNDIYAFEKPEVCICERVDSLAKQMQLNLPISLYFHNDEPNPNSRDTVSEVNYEDSFREYYLMREQYKQRFGQVLAGNLKTSAEQEMQVFFEHSIRKGFEQLETFAIQLQLAMDLEASVEIKIKGFTSPLNDTEYNMALAKRRINSIQNYLYTYQNGIFLPYIKNRQLKITELPFGESQVKIGVSDNPNDRRQSVYSIAAARERRIEIQSISFQF